MIGSPLLLARQPMLPIHSVGVIVGSFDPLHRGHQWMVQQMSRRFELVLLLVPVAHFEKTVRFPHNATRAQRVELIERVHRGQPVIGGLTRELLFVRLIEHLARQLPGVQVGLGLGSDTYGKLLRSRSYFAWLGLPWGPAEEQALSRLAEQSVVFARDRHVDLPAGALVPPTHLRGISSTLVRRRAVLLHAARAGAGRWHDELGPLVGPEVVSFIRELGLYGRGPCLRRIARQAAPTPWAVLSSSPATERA